MEALTTSAATLRPVCDQHFQDDFPRIRVLSTNISALRFDQVVGLITRWARNGERGHMVSVANVHMLVEAKVDAGFGAVLHRSDIITPDGMPLVWLMRRLGAPSQDRVAGMDLLPALCQSAEANDLPVYFVGSTPRILGATQERLAALHPRLRVAGLEPLPFRTPTAAEDEALVNRINSSGAGFVFVSLGCPKQERWICRNVSNVRAVLVGIGAALPVYAGIRRRAPAILQKNGLEWFYRLLQEPRRLTGRYLTTNSLFLLWMLSEWLQPHWPGSSPPNRISRSQ